MLQFFWECSECCSERLFTLQSVGVLQILLRCEMLCSVAGFLGVFIVLQSVEDFDEM